MPCFEAHQPTPPSSFPPASESSFVMCHASKLTTHFFLFLPSSWWVLVCVMPPFKAQQPAPPSSSPPAGESSFVMCHASKLTNPLLPLPPLQLVSPHLCHAPFQSSPTHSSLFLPSSE